MPTTGPIILGLQRGPSYYLAHNKYCTVYCGVLLHCVLLSADFDSAVSCLLWSLTEFCGVCLSSVNCRMWTFMLHSSDYGGVCLRAVLSTCEVWLCLLWGRLRCVLHDYCGTSVLSTVKFVKFYSAMSWHLRSLLCGVYCEVWLRGVLPTAEEAGIII